MVEDEGEGEVEDVGWSADEVVEVEDAMQKDVLACVHLVYENATLTRSLKRRSSQLRRSIPSPNPSQPPESNPS